MKKDLPRHGNPLSEIPPEICPHCTESDKARPPALPCRIFSHKTLSFIYKDPNNNVSGDLVLDTDNKPNIKQKKSSTDAINVFDLSQEDQNTIKNDANSLLVYGLYDKLIDYVKPICSPELSCTCDDTTEMCTCNKGSTFVTCKKSQIENKE